MAGEVKGGIRRVLMSGWNKLAREKRRQQEGAGEAGGCEVLVGCVRLEPTAIIHTATKRHFVPKLVVLGFHPIM